MIVNVVALILNYSSLITLPIKSVGASCSTGLFQLLKF